MPNDQITIYCITKASHPKGVHLLRISFLSSDDDSPVVQVSLGVLFPLAAMGFPVS